MIRILMVFQMVAVAVVLAHGVIDRSDAEEPRATTQNVTIAAREGVGLVAVVHRPVESNGVAVVIGSGRGYHKDLPLLVRSAEALQNAGFTAIRFDWAYFTAKGQPSPNLSAELLDLDAVIAYARELEGIDALFLAGKSLGSIAATLRALRQPDDLDGLILLTLPLHSPNAPDTIFDDMQKLQSWTKPLMIVCGDADPFSELGVLYRYAGGFEQAPRLIIVPGDHSMRGPKKDEARTGENVDLAAHGVAVWASRWHQGGS